MQLLGNRVLLEPIRPDTVSRGGIMFPVQFNDERMKFTVLAVGPGRRLKDGSRVPMEVKPGDKVLCTQYHGTCHTFDDGRIIVTDQDLAMVWD